MGLRAVEPNGRLVVDEGKIDDEGMSCRDQIRVIDNDTTYCLTIAIKDCVVDRA